MEWLAPFPADKVDERLPLGDVRALVQRGWWTVLSMYHAQLDEAAQEMIRGYLRQHMRGAQTQRMWCWDEQPPLPLVPGFGLMTVGAGVKDKAPKLDRRVKDQTEQRGVMRELALLPLPHLWRTGESWTDGGDEHIQRFGKARIYLFEAPAASVESSTSGST